MGTTFAGSDQAGAIQRAASAGMDRKDDRQPNGQALEDRREPIRVVHVLRAVKGEQEVPVVLSGHGRKT